MNAERIIFRITVWCIVTFVVLLFAVTLLEILASHPEILIALCLILLIGFVSYVLIVRPRRAGKTHGSARFALSQEIRKARLFYPRFLNKKQHWLRLGKYGTRVIALPEVTQQAHTLMLAPTRAGKSTSIIIPNLLQEQGTRSLLINDLKGELVGLTRGYLAQHMPTYVLTPTLPHLSGGYNPLAHIRSLEDAQDVASCIVANTGGEGSEPFWDNATKLLLTATMLHLQAVEPQAPFYRLAQILSTSIRDFSTTIQSSPSPLAKSVASAFLANVLLNERLSGSIMTEVNARLLSLKIPALQQVTSKNTIPFDSPTPVAIFLHIPPDETERLKWLTSCFTMQLMKHITKQQNGQKWAFYLDELANMGHIPHYLEYISYVGGLGVSLIQAAQDFGQVERLYGENGLTTILANSSTQLVFPGCGLREASHYSSVLGDSTVYTNSYTWQGIQMTPGRGRTETARKLMNPDEVRRLKSGKLMIFSKNLPAFQIQSLPFFRNRDLLKLTRIPYTPTTQPVPEIPPIPQPNMPDPESLNKQPDKSDFILP